MDLFTDAAGGIDIVALEKIRATGKAKPREATIAIAHGLAYDPHVDGRLRLTPVGREKLRAATAA